MSSCQNILYHFILSNAILSIITNSVIKDKLGAVRLEKSSADDEEVCKKSV